MKKIFGIGLVLMITLSAIWLGGRFPNIGAGGFGLIIGILISSLFTLEKRYSDGINFSAKTLLHFSIVLLGASINIKSIFHTGLYSFPVILSGVAVSFLTANIMGKVLKLDFETRNLIGAGTGICGGSAIAAVSAIIKPDENKISYSLSTIFFFNIIAVFLFPLAGHIFHMSQNFFGMFAGSAVNDTSSVIATAYIFGNEAGRYATTVKLTRTMMIIPVILIFSWIMSRREKSYEKISLLSKFPWFISGFIIMSIINTVFNNENTESLFSIFSTVGKFMIIMAISAIGLKTDFKKIVKSGFKPIALGLITWIAVIASTITVQIIFNIK